MRVVAERCLAFVPGVNDVHCWSMALCAATVLLAVGCGKTDHGDRLPISGTVSVVGQPLDVKATIYFDPIQGETGVGSSGEVSEGRFAIPAETGPTPGLTYKVTLITSPGIPAEGTPNDQIKQSERYEQQVEVPARDAEDAELAIDFETKTQ